MSLPAQNLILIWSTLISISVATESCVQKTKFATVDDNFTVYFERCEECYCEIKEAWMEHPTLTSIQTLNETNFWVNFIQGELPNGSYHYEFWYEGLCSELVHPHTCFGYGIFLHLRIANFQLTVKSTNITAGNNISLHCNSGLETSNDIQTIFTFTSLENDTQINMTCESNTTTDKYFDHWRIHRSLTSPHDCYLEVMNAHITDAGIYQCAGRLPTDVGEYKDAFSNSVTIHMEEPSWEVNVPSKGSDAGLIVGVVIVVILLAVLGVVVAVGPVKCLRRKLGTSSRERRGDLESEPLTTTNTIGRPRNRGHSSQSEELVSTGTPQNSSQRYGSAAHSAGRRQPALATGPIESPDPEVGENRVSVPTGVCTAAKQSHNGYQDNGARGEASNPKKQPQLGENLSTEIKDEYERVFNSSELGENLSTEIKDEYGRVFNSSESADGPTPPSTAPHDDNLKCLYCPKKYRQGQIQAFKRHTTKTCRFKPSNC